MEDVRIVVGVFDVATNTFDASVGTAPSGLTMNEKFIGAAAVGFRTLQEVGSIGQWTRKQVELITMQNLVMFEVEPEAEYLFLDAAFAVKGGLRTTLEIIHLLTDENPIQVLINAVVNAGPREDSTRVGSAGVVRRQAVDVSPFRRVNQAIYLLATGARAASFRNVKTIAECLADEIINAAKGSSNSFAIKKKDETERVAKANR